MKSLPEYIDEKRLERIIESADDNVLEYEKHRHTVKNSRHSVRHAVETSDDTAPDGYSSRIEYWSDQTGFEFSPDGKYTCDCCGEEHYGREFVGAHVQKTNRENARKYYYPTCDNCNKKYKGENAETKYFTIDPDWLIPVPYDD